jgi:hypothetical protein
LNQAGIAASLRAVNLLNEKLVDNIYFRCSLSHGLMEYLKSFDSGAAATAAGIVGGGGSAAPRGMNLPMGQSKQQGLYQQQQRSNSPRFVPRNNNFLPPGRPQFQPQQQQQQPRPFDNFPRGFTTSFEQYDSSSPPANRGSPSIMPLTTHDLLLAPNNNHNNNMNYLPTTASTSYQQHPNHHNPTNSDFTVFQNAHASAYSSSNDRSSSASMPSYYSQPPRNHFL